MIDGVLISHDGAPQDFFDIAGRLVTPSGSLAADSNYLTGMVSDHPRLENGWLGDFMTVYDDTPLTPDSGISGQLIGNRSYLPWLGKYK